MFESDFDGRNSRSAVGRRSFLALTGAALAGAA
jgi:hypothetical protein